MKKKVIVLSSCIVLLLIICFGVANREYPVLENSSEMGIKVPKVLNEALEKISKKINK